MNVHSRAVVSCACSPNCCPVSNRVALRATFHCKTCRFAVRLSHVSLISRTVRHEDRTGLIRKLFRVSELRLCVEVLGHDL